MNEADATPPAPLIEEPVYLLGVLLTILAGLFTLRAMPFGQRLYRIIPLLVFAYFLPALLSNTGVIPTASPLYGFVKKWLLPASLLLMTLSVDLKGILRLGPKVIILFLTATAGIVIGGPLAYLILGSFVDPEMGEQAWKGLAALSGSWIGGGANFVAIGDSVGAEESTIGLMVVVDVAVANVWMAILLYFAAKDKAMDAKIGADSRSVDELRERVASYQADVAKPTSLADLLVILAIGLGTAALANVVSRGFEPFEWRGIQFAYDGLPEVGQIISKTTWVVLIVTTVGLLLSFTRLRQLEGVGASAVGSVMIYLLVTTIGAHAEFARVVEVPVLVAVGALWMVIHAVLLLAMRRFLKAPIFYLAVGSKANVGGAASAPIVASAFHPALAPVGVLLAVGGYVLGTYAGLACAFLLEQVHGILHG